MTECAVCLRETMLNPQQLSCLHSFCLECIPKPIEENNRFVECPSCRTRTQRADIKADFKLRELINACSNYSSRTEKATHHLSELLVLNKKELQTSLDTVTKKNREFKDVAVSKIRAAKRVWYEAFEKSAKKLENEIEKRADDDDRVRTIKRAIGTVDSKIHSMTSSTDNNQQTASVLSVMQKAKHVDQLLNCIPDASSERAIRVWQHWNVTERKSDVARATDLLLNPATSRQLLSEIDMFEPQLPGTIAFKYHFEEGYFPFFDPGDRDDDATIKTEETDSSESEVDA